MIQNLYFQHLYLSGVFGIFLFVSTPVFIHHIVIISDVK